MCASVAKQQQCLLVFFKGNLFVVPETGVSSARNANIRFQGGHVGNNLDVPAVSLPSALVEALLKLRQELQQMGSNLIVAPGPWEETLPALATKVGAQAIIAEEEVEFKWVLEIMPSSVEKCQECSALREGQARFCRHSCIHGFQLVYLGLFERDISRGKGAACKVPEQVQADPLLCVKLTCCNLVCMHALPVHCTRRQASVDVLESLAAKGIRAYHWSADVWPNSAFTSNYRTWKRQRPQHNAPLDAPASMPAVPADVPA
eukprot:scaffold127315_cov15-Tisochrysis_lutea.AAC.1